MNETRNILLEIEFSDLAKIESLLTEEITRQDELARAESFHLGKIEIAKIENLLTEEKNRNIKWNYYQDVCNSCDAEKFPYAIALIESLARHLPDNSEVRQWQASTYQRWGRKLVEEKQITKARIYLKKALKIDPHNRTLWSEVERDFRGLETILTDFAA